MDRLELLKGLEKLVIEKGLESYEIRLYLLLLANCSWTGNGEIDHMTIKIALGGEFSRSYVEKVCQRLFSCKLITFSAIISVGPSEEDFTLSYMISPASLN
jgi:hypothetical protein